MKKTLVMYFSASGTTKMVAEKLAGAVGAELYELKPAVPYTRADLNWQDQRSRSSEEMNSPKSRPELSEPAPDVSGYDRLFLGFPIWWYTAPRVVQTFLESGDFSGKTIVLFATSGSSGLGQTAEDLAKSCPGAKLISGRVFRAGVSADELRRWAESC